MESTHTEKDEVGVDRFFCDHHSLTLANKKNVTTFQKLVPLLYVFAVIFFLSSVRQFATGINPFLFMMDFMGIFFIVFGLFKLVDLRGFVEGFKSYDFIAKRYTAYGYAYPFIEIALGVLYILGFMFVWQTLLVLFLSAMGIYTAYIAIKHEDEIPCVCLGTLFDFPMTWVTFTENTIMFLMALFMMVM
ncbi:MAG: MauE/DoxX family redox-associated membrane protein [Candidatus Paceibacterota bacterium]